MIRINTGADLEDLWGGQTQYEVAVEMFVGPDVEILGAGHTVAEAVEDARATLRRWRECDFCGGEVVGERKVDGRAVRVCESCAADCDRARELDEREERRTDDHDPFACPGCGGSCLRACR